MSNAPDLDKNNFTEEESSFDIKEWFFHFLHYWYLFVIAILIALGASYLKNRTWLPEFQTSGTMIIESGGNAYGSQAIMQGFGVQSGYRNMNNQVIMLRSYDLLSRVVDSLPFMRVDYINKGRFKTRNLYRNTPIYITSEHLSPDAYNHLYKISLRKNGTYTITIDEEKNYSSFKLDGKVGEPLVHNLFSITVTDLRDYSDDVDMYFQFKSKERLVNEFYSRLQFAYVMEGASILQVSLNSQTPDRDVDFINKLCDVFILDNLTLKNHAAIKTITFIDDQLDLLQESLAVSEDEMTSFRQSNQIVDVSSYVGDILAKSTQYDNKKRELELQENYLNYLVNHIQNNIDGGGVIAPLTLGVNDAMLIQLVQQINDKYLELGELSERNIYYDKTKKEIEILKNSISEVVKSMRLSLSIEKDEVTRRLREIDNEIKKLPQKELQMIAIERRYRVDDNYYTFFLQKRAEAEIQKASNRPDNSVLDKARVMSVTNGKAPTKTMTTYLLLGLLIPAVFVLLLKLLNNKITTEKDAEKASSFPLIGSVRHTQSQDPMLAIKKPRSSYAEMYRVIRTRLEFIVQRKSDILITVSSAESGDGKTYFGANLAAVYAVTGKKTLLVDMDIRKPNIYELFDMPNDPGITNYLLGEATLSNIIKHTENNYYDVLTVGSIPPNPGEIVRSEKLKNMFQELRKTYEYIIVDTSPIGLVADAYPIAMMSDINLFVVRMNKTNKTVVKKLTEQLKNDKLPHVYTILNDVAIEKNRYTKYSAYNYGYGYGYGTYGTNLYRSKKKKKAAENLSRYYTDDKDI